MLVNLSEVMNRRGEALEVCVETGFDEFCMNGNSYPVKKKTPVRLTIKSPSPRSQPHSPAFKSAPQILQIPKQSSRQSTLAGNASYPVKKKTPVRLTIKSPSPKKVFIAAEAEYVLSAPCDRCLREVEFSIPISYEQEVDFSKAQEECPDGLEEILLHFTRPGTLIFQFALRLSRLAFECLFFGQIAPIISTSSFLFVSFWICPA